MNKLDSLLNKITMYRLVLYALMFIIAAAFALSGFGILNYSLGRLAASLGFMLAFGAVTHYALRWAFKSGTSVESWIITVPILFVILRPADDLASFSVLGLGVAIAMASKYLLAVAGKHIFNPAAIALVALTLLGSGEVFWWIGADVMLPVVLTVGLLVVRKIRRFGMVAVFALTALTAFAVSSGAGLQLNDLLKNAVLSGPLVFFAAIMLTEPATTPPTKRWRVVYGALVGLLYGAHFQLGTIHSSPELALVAGNLFAYAVSSKYGYRLSLASRVQHGGGVYEFIFTPNRPLKFQPGQYLEFTLPHSKPDSRGNRRYFTIASSPEDKHLKLGVRIHKKSSSFKNALLKLKERDKLWASQLGGDFTLPEDKNKKLVFIAGGVGITPFRSMASHMLHTGQDRDITLFYCSGSANDFAFHETFDKAARLGVKTHYVITGKKVPDNWKGLSGYLTKTTVQTHIPSYKKAVFYISGPGAMVTAYKKILLSSGVPLTRIKTDYFPGF